MKRIFTTLAQKWPEYLLEILVITIGILGAFALNSWNQGRIEHLEEREVIRNIKGDINNTILEFQKLNKIRNDVVSSTNLLLEFSEYDLIEISVLDSLLGLTFYRPTFNNTLGSINLLFSSGKINLIKNDSIRNPLISLPGEIDDLVEEEVYSNESFHDHYVPIVFRHINFEEVPLFGFGSTLIGISGQRAGKTTPVKKSNYNALLRDQEFRNHISLRRNQMDLTNRETLFLIEKLNSLTKLIDKELSK